MPLYCKSEESKRWWKFYPHGQPKVDSQLLLKQTHKYWANNDEMLLGDVNEFGGPEDPFKINRVQKPGTREVTDKVTNQNHFDNNNLTGVIAPQLDRKMKITWSECMSQFATKDRLFANVIEQAKCYEQNDHRREVETDLFHKQRKRGTTVDDRHQKSNISMTINKPNKSSTTNALGGGNPHQKSNTHDTIDSQTKTVDVQQRQNFANTSAAKDDSSQMGTTLMARVANMNRTMPNLVAASNGKKDQTVSSSVNLASKATATSMNGTNQKTIMSQTAFGATSPFRDTTQKGIVSGMGLLTF